MLFTYRKLKKILEEQILKKTCRICLSGGGENIFDYKEFDLADSIRNILGVQVCVSATFVATSL